MSKWIKKNYMSITAMVLSITAICFVLIRIDPVDFNDGSMVTMVVGLMGVCATIMVASQVIGLRTSEDQIKSMIEKESINLREISRQNTIKSLFRVEVIAIASVVQLRAWDAFVPLMERLESYATDLKDNKMATDAAKVLINTEETFHFLKELSENDRERIHKCVLALIKLVSDPSKLIHKFINNDEDATK